MTFMYDSPGGNDNLTKKYLLENPNDKESKLLLDEWNKEIVRQYENLDYVHSDFFNLDFTTFPDQQGFAVKWFADPAEPEFCRDADVAKTLSDWGTKGRHNLHNEYCEYSIIYRTDKTGKNRPKRVQFTTELREYWMLFAVFAPHRLRYMATAVLGYEPTWGELYGVENPFLLTENMRRYHFAKQNAGHGQDKDLKDMGVPAQPEGGLNTKNALFMTHPINGLDDLLYIVMFGAHPYAFKDENGSFKKADKEDIFRSEGVEHLACRHADPAAAMAAYGAAFEGKPVGFQDGLCMFMHSFNETVFTYKVNDNHESLPEEWIRHSRNGQHLEFGHSDSEDYFLDQIYVEENGKDVPLSGGYQIAKHIEVGPFVLIGNATGNTEYKEIEKSSSNIKCNEAKVCDRIATLEREYYGEKLLGMKKSKARSMNE